MIIVVPRGKFLFSEDVLRNKDVRIISTEYGNFYVRLPQFVYEDFFSNKMANIENSHSILIGIGTRGTLGPSLSPLHSGC